MTLSSFTCLSGHRLFCSPRPNSYYRTFTWALPWHVSPLYTACGDFVVQLHAFALPTKSLCSGWQTAWNSLPQTVRNV